jgi:hypothetical protein
MLIIKVIIPMMIMMNMQKVIIIRILTINLDYSYCDDDNDFCGVHVCVYCS